MKSSISALVLLLACRAALAQSNNSDWVFVPSFNMPVNVFWGQFWSIVTWLQGFTLPILGLGVGTAAVTFVIKRAFFTGGG